jgi:hypothetical protein
MNTDLHKAKHNRSHTNKWSRIMYKQNKNKIHQIYPLAIMLLLGANTMAEEMQDEYESDIQPQNMAEEILTQGESALARTTNDWQRTMLDSLTSQLQQSSESLIAIKPVIAPQPRERSWDISIPKIESPTRLPTDAPAALRFTLHGRQLLQNTSEYLNQVKG